MPAGDWPSLSGSSWDVAATAAAAITSGKLPPFVVVGIDHSGDMRGRDYTPYKPGSGPGGFRWVVSAVLSLVAVAG